MSRQTVQSDRIEADEFLTDRVQTDGPDRWGTDKVPANSIRKGERAKSNKEPNG